MKAKSLYRKHSRIWEAKIREIITYFSLDLPAVKTCELTWLNNKTIDNWYNYIRRWIYWLNSSESEEMFSWIIEADETYCWPKRIPWKRWRWAWMKTIVFGLLKRNWKVYAEIVPDAKAKTLKPIIRRKIESWSEINTDWWLWYDWLVDMWYAKHYRVHHGANEFARWKQHVNWIESFWSYFLVLLGVNLIYFSIEK